MLADPRLAAASGLAAVAGVALILVGRLDLAAPGVVMLLAAAGAAVASAAPEPDRAARATVAVSVPAWVLIVVWGALRAGSVHLVDVRGAHAVAGIALVRGPAPLVVGAWAALAAAGLLVAAQASGPARLAVPIALAHVGLAVTLVAGPQISEVSDAVPWLLASAGIGAIAWAARSQDRRRLLRIATVLGVAAAMLGVVGGRL